jgi:hypothetical protein
LDQERLEGVIAKIRERLGMLERWRLTPDDRNALHELRATIVRVLTSADRRN